MAASPFDHVMDHPEWHLFDKLFGGLHIPLPSFTLFGYEFQVTKFMILELFAAGLIIAIFVPLARWSRNGETPKGFIWNTFESILTFIRDQVARPYIGEHDADRFVPFLWTMFLFILFCNLLGMIPFMGSPTASISVTGALAVCSFLVIHGAAIAKMGPIHYLKSYVPHIGLAHGVRNPLMRLLALGIEGVLVVFIVGIELMGHIIKAFVLAVRLFANMFAGHTVLAVILLFIPMAKGAGILLFGGITLGSVLGVTALSLLELFVAFLQAFIFVFLTSLFLGSTLHPEH